MQIHIYPSKSCVDRAAFLKLSRNFGLQEETPMISPVLQTHSFPLQVQWLVGSLLPYQSSLSWGGFICHSGDPLTSFPSYFQHKVLVGLDICKGGFIYSPIVTLNCFKYIHVYKPNVVLSYSTKSVHPAWHMSWLSRNPGFANEA